MGKHIAGKFDGTTSMFTFKLDEGEDYQKVFLPGAWAPHVKNPHFGRFMRQNMLILIVIAGRPDFTSLLKVVSTDNQSVVVQELFCKSDEREVKAETPELYVKYDRTGEHWYVVRKSDGAKFADIKHPTKAAAIDWINAHVGTLKAAA